MQNICISFNIHRYKVQLQLVMIQASVTTAGISIERLPTIRHTWGGQVLMFFMKKALEIIEEIYYEFALRSYQ